MDEGAKLLPLLNLNGTDYLIDLELRQFRGFRNPQNIVSMHSKTGKQMVRKMKRMEWRRYGISTGRQDAGRKDWYVSWLEWFWQQEIKATVDSIKQ